MNTYQCKNDIISEDERKQLLSEAMSCDYHNYETDKKTHTGNEFISFLDCKCCHYRPAAEYFVYYV